MSQPVAIQQEIHQSSSDNRQPVDSINNTADSSQHQQGPPNTRQVFVSD
jgi:hypothetical protein